MTDFDAEDPSGPRPHALAIAGPTGSGKSGIAQGLAEAYPGRVVLVAMDSLQVFRGMDIGTAKPKLAERARARYLGLDLVDPDQEFSVKNWLDVIEPQIEDEFYRGNIPILVGGTGYYLRAIAEGTYSGPRSDPEVRAHLQARLESEGLETLRRELAAVSPADAVRSDLNPRRVLRALEVLALTGKPPAAQPWRRSKIAVTKLALQADRRALDLRLRDRIYEQLDEGLIGEVSRLLARFGRGIAPLQAIAYREPVRYLHGELQQSEMIEVTWARNRAYARRQLTWLKGEPQVTWHDPDSLAGAARNWIARFERHVLPGTRP